MHTYLQFECCIAKPKNINIESANYDTQLKKIPPPYLIAKINEEITNLVWLQLK